MFINGVDFLIFGFEEKMEKKKKNQ